MFDALFNSLASYEAAISSIVGLLTLGAAIWGAVRLSTRGRQDGNAPGQSPASGASATRMPMLSLGVSEHSRLEELVAVRAVNVVLLCLLVLSLPWLIVCLLVVQSTPLTLVILAVFSGSLLGLGLQHAGATVAARWLAILLATFFWLSVMLVNGPMQGTEYFVAALLALPVLILSRAQWVQRLLCLAIVGAVFAFGTQMVSGAAPSAAVDDGLATFSYHANALFLAGIIFASVSYYKAFAGTSYELLASKKARNEALVSRLIPADLARNVASTDNVAARWHPEGTVLVATLTGFSELYTRLPAVDIVTLLDELYSSFDELIDELGAEKVKTLGTTYVAAAGLADSANGGACVAASALAMRDVAERFAREHRLPIGFRCAIATGLTISGVIGKARPRFDLWGEALDDATALEVVARTGEILVNDTAFWRLREAFAIEEGDTFRLTGLRGRDELAS